MRLVLVSGLSGSGKTVALKALEDDGWYCVDNLPATLVLEVADFLVAAGHDRVAVSVDARSAALPALPEAIARLRAREIDCQVLFLEASSQVLLRRFQESRRRHPLAGPGLTLAETLEHERRLLASVAELGHRIDTSELQTKVLRGWIAELLGARGGALTVLFESFAFSGGIPLDADWVIDARMLPNPYYEPALRPLTGRDAAVAEFLAREPVAQRLLGDVRDFLARWLPDIAADSRSYLTVAIGCTGGRHRSVYLAEELARAFGGRWRVLVRHRMLENEAPRG